MKHRITLTLCSLILSFSSPVWGAEQHLSLQTILKTVLQQQPDLALSQLQQQQLRINQDAIQEQLDPRYSVSGTLSDEKSPTTSPFAPSGTTIGLLSGSISKPLEDGSTLTATASYTRAKTTYPNTVPTAFQASINPTYQHQIDLIYRYPLLRGHDNITYQEQLKQNEASIKAATWQTRIAQEQWAAQAIQLYYQLAANAIAMQISHDAVLRAKELLAYQKRREHFGLIEKADRLQAEALLASRQMDESNAQATWNSSQTSLNRLMQRDYDQPITLQPETISMPDHHALNELLDLAKKQRPLFHMLDAQEAADFALLEQAREGEQRQLDLIGQIGSRSLSGSALTAYGQGFTLKDRYISMGFELSDTLNQHDSRPNIQKAELELERIHLQRLQGIENITTEITNALTQYNNGLMTKEASQKRAKTEKKKFTAEMRRYRQGRSDTATIVQFEGELRTAELQAALQDIQIQMALYQLKLSTGSLLKELI